jgi:hypothetical protein
MSTDTQKACRMLTAEDVQLLTQFDPDRFAALDLCKELNAPGFYIWMGLFSSDRLLAVHRSMRLGFYLLLKGLYVAPELRGSHGGLQLAIALREHARLLGYHGVVAWVELAKPERELATRLRIKVRGPVVHRFELPLEDLTASENGPVGKPNADRPNYSGKKLIEPQCKPMVPDLIKPYCNDGQVFHWVSDQYRIVLSANPCGRLSDIRSLTSMIAPIARSVGATALEFPILASDLRNMLSIVSYGARRLSRSAVCLGMCDFGTSLKQFTPEIDSDQQTVLGEEYGT